MKINLSNEDEHGYRLGYRNIRRKALKGFLPQPPQVVSPLCFNLCQREGKLVKEGGWSRLGWERVQERAVVAANESIKAFRGKFWGFEGGERHIWEEADERGGCAGRFSDLPEEREKDGGRPGFQIGRKEIGKKRGLGPWSEPFREGVDERI